MSSGRILGWKLGKPQPIFVEPWPQIGGALVILYLHKIWYPDSTPTTRYPSSCYSSNLKSASVTPQFSSSQLKKNPQIDHFTHQLFPSHDCYGNSSFITTSRQHIRKGHDDFRLFLLSLVFYLCLIIALSEKHVTMMEPPQPKQYHPISR
jgi:hypothetical protein